MTSGYTISLLFPEQVHSNVVFSQDLEHFNQEYHEDNI